MRRQQPLRLLCLALAAASQALLALVAPALVVCQEGDGRAVVELRVSGCCEEGAEPAASAAALRSLAAPGDDCGACDDALVSFPLREEGAAPGLPPVRPALVGVDQAPSLARPRPRLGAPATGPPNVDPLSSLRTVVLRC